MKQIDLIAGARPNFVKIASLIHANRELGEKIKFRLIHTGQHYDKNLSESFFSSLELPPPDYNLGVGSGSQAEQTAAIMIGYEQLIKKEKPYLCIIVGDVTSSMACAITAKKMRVKVAHIEAGLRSYDWWMPEEVNRVLIDSIADYFFTTTQEASQYLLSIGKLDEEVFFVGNTMIDTLIRFRNKFRRPEVWSHLNLKEKAYYLLTLHRPANLVETKKTIDILKCIDNNSVNLPVIFPAHPRALFFLKDLNLEFQNIKIISALEYLEFNYLMHTACMVITDSGGITEETTYFGVPCLTLRENTERPETVTVGSNKLIGSNLNKIGTEMKSAWKGDWKKSEVPKLWDGKTGERIINILSNL